MCGLLKTDMRNGLEGLLLGTEGQARKLIGQNQMSCVRLNGEGDCEGQSRDRLRDIQEMGTPRLSDCSAGAKRVGRGKGSVA